VEALVGLAASKEQAMTHGMLASILALSLTKRQTPTSTLLQFISHDFSPPAFPGALDNSTSFR
jgi:hypothetical protein